jgi:hypothetical protein
MVIQCKECHKEISSDARVCPHCGKKLRMGAIAKAFLILLCVVGGIILIGFIGEMSETVKRANGTKPETPKAAETPQKESWNYGQTTDKMTGKVTKFACLDSEDQLQFGFPYDGGSTGTICLRRRQELEAFFKIDKGQILCGVDECEATLRVDGGQPFKMSGSESSDDDSRFMFLDPASRLLALARKAKEIKIETLYFEEGSKTLTFEPSQPLDPKW